MPKILTVGLLITDGKSLLIGKSRLSKFWDIPKGRQEKGESHLETLKREVWEEIGLNLTQNIIINLEDLGQFTYNKEKNLYLFLYHIDDLLPTENFECYSTFKQYGKIWNEMDDYKYILFEDILDHLPKRLGNIVIKVLGEKYVRNN